MTSESSSDTFSLQRFKRPIDLLKNKIHCKPLQPVPSIKYDSFKYDLSMRAAHATSKHSSCIVSYQSFASHSNLDQESIDFSVTSFFL